jgi:hypothetical protein
MNSFLARFKFSRTYTEDTLSFSAVAFFLLFFNNVSFRTDIMDLSDKNFIIFIALFLSGAVLSIFHAFSKRKKNYVEKVFMIIFIVFLNFAVGVSAGGYIFRQETINTFLLIFPLWNIISAFWLMFLLRHRFVWTHSISDTNVIPRDFIIGAILVILIFIFSQYVFENYWAITFSMCLGYTELLHPLIKKTVTIKNATQNS